jgi:hypothetical protein
LEEELFETTVNYDSEIVKIMKEIAKIVVQNNIKLPNVR